MLGAKFFNQKEGRTEETQTFVRNFLVTVNASDLIKSFDVRRKATMYTQYLFINQLKIFIFED